MTTFLFIVIIISLVGMAVVLWNTHNDLVPLRSRVEETKANLLSKQMKALHLVNTYATIIAAFHSKETPIFTSYLHNMERATRSGVAGGQLVNIFQTFAPPSTQAAPLYSTTISEATHLNSEFDIQVQGYNAAVSALNNRKRLFPANLFAREFFEIPDATYLKAEECQLLPPGLVAAHLKQAREIYLAEDNKKAAT